MFNSYESVPITTLLASLSLGFSGLLIILIYYLFEVNKHSKSLDARLWGEGKPVHDTYSTKAGNGIASRNTFFCLLIIACVMRIIDLMGLVYEGDRGSGYYQDREGGRDAVTMASILFWIREFFFLYPSLIFWSCFAYVTEFFITIYYMTYRWTSGSLVLGLRFLYFSIHGCFLVAIFYSAMASGYRNAFVLFGHGSLFVLYGGLGGVSCYYGVRTAIRFAPVRRNQLDSSSQSSYGVLKRIICFSLLAPLFYSIRCLSELVMLVSFRSASPLVLPLRVEILYSTTVYAITEFIPSAVIVYIFRPQMPAGESPLANNLLKPLLAAGKHVESSSEPREFRSIRA